MKKIIAIVAMLLCVTCAFSAKKAKKASTIKIGIVNNPPSESGYRAANVKDFETVFTAGKNPSVKAIL